MIKIKRFLKSLSYSWQGLKKVFKEEQNFQIHCLAGIIVIILSVILRIKAIELIIIILLIALVFILEIINSIVERFVDILKPRIHFYVKDLKDMSAAMVFVGAIAAAIIGLIIFIPYFIK